MQMLKLRRGEELGVRCWDDREDGDMVWCEFSTAGFVRRRDGADGPLLRLEEEVEPVGGVFVRFIHCLHPDWAGPWPS
jgi:hypothetical protein